MEVCVHSVCNVSSVLFPLCSHLLNFVPMSLYNEEPVLEVFLFVLLRCSVIYFPIC